MALFSDDMEVYLTLCLVKESLIAWLSRYSRTLQIETADLSQSHAGLNLSQFQTDCLLRINSSTAILNHLNH